MQTLLVLLLTAFVSFGGTCPQRAGLCFVYRDVICCVRRRRLASRLDGVRYWLARRSGAHSCSVADLVLPLALAQLPVV